MSEQDNGPQKRQSPTTWTVISLLVQAARLVVDLVRLIRDSVI
ncbi:putative protein OS=Tsukamurella paurometabola (strain ATCC 8368 / DSM / CCUG 35730 /CIP 100753 / JCM 10117 / KCTC 9821 / NBRC 16120 / NCIMB 702349/ NCTC 13040) OX=521096 GN=Tpau_0271 PE=4 SV=1 [Tsukamurella paurometabola]|uniref:Uncharacterized protein n=1 Tax=Tsukamurella paurometabola (strain ATCC 8368 / DSM 20162 / CCUG 35730 / CIP 100753 / JCM 10117 / KCTC 9821 / NBRC 16120 / NCIMB 702349 / NCTC 13040) TaxID=521096 RepID=D5UQT7_TSUPD|nr:hypothetical protein Tpau_0271 [Tsukamurella paurometabola DSM 20162]SUP42205.1 Uncharacterised protein [Tsukamurella paurometabola]